MSRRRANPSMTDREVALLVRDGLVDQGGPSVSELGGSCRYRGAGDRRCAAGLLLADEHYREEFEGLSSDAPAVWAALVASGVPARQETRALVHRLQGLHDSIALDASARDREEWDASIERRIADELALLDPADAADAGVAP